MIEVRSRTRVPKMGNKQVKLTFGWSLGKMLAVKVLCATEPKSEKFKKRSHKVALC